MEGVSSEAELAAACRALMAPGRHAPPIAAIGRAIEDGHDPLGDTFLRLRSPTVRRARGATYTPAAIVRAMVAWAAHGDAPPPRRVIDPGTGSARFLVAAGRAFPQAALVGVELDPLAALLARAHLHAAGLGARARILEADYRTIALPPVDGPTLFLGNPPYVRHHDVDDAGKRWLHDAARARGLPASALAGLHVHFFLATLLHARPGDRGALITAAEWLDVNYGKLVRALVAGPLGGVGLHVLAPEARPFDDALATAAITCFEVGTRARTVHVRRVADVAGLGELGAGRPIERNRLAAAARWSPLLVAPAPRAADGLVELGELCDVRRGQVTGANACWIADDRAAALPPRFLVPTVTRARELFAAAPRLGDAAALRRVIDLPAELDALEPDERRAVDAFLRRARAAGVPDGYVARHRRAWWAVGLHAPAPLLATYMARRPPAFVVNGAGVRHLNIAHGLYPRVPLAPAALERLAAYLSGGVSLADGRVYAGGLVKFEPGEMARLRVPPPDALT